VKYFLLFALLASQNSWGMGDVPVRGILPVQLSSGRDHSCALDLNGVKCWGSNIYGHTLVPPLKHPMQISAGPRHTCALDAEGVKCWGDDYKFSSDKIPSLINPRQVSVGNFNTCALDAEGVKCWGSSWSGQNDVPPLNNPLQVSTGEHHTCAIDSDGVKCWGRNEAGQLDVPALKNPIQVATGYFYSCALDAEGVKCWGVNRDGQLNVPALKNPKQISSSDFTICALDDEGVKCWGDKFGLGIQPRLYNPQQVAVGNSHVCALDSEGVKCWGQNFYGQIDVPKLYLNVVETAALKSTATRAEFIKAIHNQIKAEDLGNETQYFEFLLVKPAIVSADSKYFANDLIGFFEAEKSELMNKLGYTNLNDDGHLIPDSDKHRTLAITAIRSALAGGLKYLGVDPRFELKNGILAAESASNEPMNNQKILDLLKQVDALVTEKQKLKSSLKSAFLVDSLEVAANWLREKAKL